MYVFVKYGYLNYFFLNSANLICQSIDISKYFRESLGIPDNESRLYLNPLKNLGKEIFLVLSSTCFPYLGYRINY